MQKLLEKIFEHETLTREEAKELLTQITDGRAKEVQIVAAISALKMRTISAVELSGFREALLDQALIPDLYTKEAIDVCGTGGDGKNTFNISTLAAVVIAGAGYKVIKHGNYGVSSLVGSSSILEELGYQFSSGNDSLNEQLRETNICFLHAPLFHPALKRVGPIRKQLGIRTFFNYLGPLVNPVQPTHQLTGVYSLELIRVYKQILSKERKEFRVVHSLDGYDEVSLTSAFKMATKSQELILYPEDLNQNPLKAADLFCGDSIGEAKAIFMNVLEDKGTAAQNSVVATNAALGIQCFKPETSFEECFQEAITAIETKAALKNFKRTIALSKNSQTISI
ncbi:MAG: anthranilate phosphoribosyltransferase [Arenicella sp.]|jgi:anthranilate phosphoribosyltransferase